MPSITPSTSPVLANPASGDSRSTLPVEETIIAEWDEPADGQQLSLALPTTSLLIISASLAVILIGCGIWLNNINLYFAAAVVAAATFALLVSRKRPVPGRHINLTTTRLVVGARQYPLSTLAGFWLEEAEEYVVINIEPQKAALLPISILFPTPNPAEVRELLLEILPQVEARQATINDTLSKYIKL